MTMQWSDCFPSGSRVLALPNWRSPRLYFTGDGPRKRWSDSALYPAFRTAARGYRLLLRARAASGLVGSRVVPPGKWLIGQFVEGVLPALGSVTVLVGEAGPFQKVTVQIRDEGGRVSGYLKYVHTPQAAERLRHEFHILSHLPSGVGPKALKFGDLGEGHALVSAPVPGTLAPAVLPPHPGVRGLLESLERTPALPLESHPWVRTLRSSTHEADAWLESLASRAWPVVINHGDLAPWNLVMDPEGGAVRAVDWEEGCLEGFPLLDLAFYYLQVGNLVCRWSPRKVLRFAAERLAAPPWPALGERHAADLLRLSALASYRASVATIGHEDSLQVWRKRLWETRL